MEGHQVARIGRLDRAPQHLPRLGILIAERIAAVEPDDVRLVPVALGEEAAVDLCACGVELAARGERAPRRHQRQIEAVRRGALDRPVEMVPEIIFARPRRIRSEEHTSELQSLMRNSYAVFCLKKKKKTKMRIR